MLFFLLCDLIKAAPMARFGRAGSNGQRLAVTAMTTRREEGGLRQSPASSLSLDRSSPEPRRVSVAHWRAEKGDAGEQLRS